MKLGMDAVKQSGVLQSHAQGFAAMTFQKQCFVLIRPVNLLSTGLIKANYATKNLHIKAKSSNWGPHAGFIPYPQRYSKLFTKHFSSNQMRLDEYQKFTRFAQESVQQGYTVKTPLLLTGERYFELLKLGLIAPASWENQQVTKLVRQPGAPQFWLVPLSGDTELAIKYQQEHFQALSKQSVQIDMFYATQLVAYSEEDDFENADFFEVLANTDYIPLTADYDLFSVCPHPKNSIGFVGLVHRVIECSLPDQKGIGSPSLKRFIKAVHQVEEGLETRNTFCDSDHGVITPFQLTISIEMNQIARSRGYRGGDLIHHGCETANPVTSIDFPILVITPGMTYFSIENMEELLQIVKDIRFYDYIFHKNPLWRSVDDLHETIGQQQLRERTGIVINWNDTLDLKAFSPQYIKNIDACLNVPNEKVPL